MPTNQTDEAAARNAWRVGSRCAIFSRSAKQWLSGAVTRIFEDAKDEWLEVSYHSNGGTRITKQAQRMSPCIRPLVECLHLRFAFRINTCHMYSCSLRTWVPTATIG